MFGWGGKRIRRVFAGPSKTLRYMPGQALAPLRTPQGSLTEAAVAPVATRNNWMGLVDVRPPQRQVPSLCSGCLVVVADAQSGLQAATEQAAACRRAGMAGKLGMQVDDERWEVEFEPGETDILLAGDLELLPAFEMAGVSLACLRHFWDQHSPGRIDPKSTTSDVCAHLVLPLTAKHSESLTAALERVKAADAHGRPFVAPATVFVSHAWRYQFVDVMGEWPPSIPLRYCPPNDHAVRCCARP